MAILTISPITISGFTFTSPPGGAWMAELPAGADPYFRISYVGSGNPKRARGLYAATTFREILLAMITSSIDLPSVRFQMNLDREADAAGVSDQFEAPNISDADLGVINTTYGAEAFCLSLGIYTFVARYYLLGTIDLAAVSRIFYDFLRRDRVDESKIRSATDFLVQNGHITQAEYNVFWDNV